MREPSVLGSWRPLGQCRRRSKVKFQTDVLRAWWGGQKHRRRQYWLLEFPSKVLKLERNVKCLSSSENVHSCLEPHSKYLDLLSHSLKAGSGSTELASVREALLVFFGSPSCTGIMCIPIYACKICIRTLDSLMNLPPWSHTPLPIFCINT